jgi:hypothetical protein
MTKDQTDRIEVIEGKLAAAYIKVGEPNTTDVEYEEIYKVAGKLEDQITAIEIEGKNFCACGCEVQEKSIHKYHREMSGGEELWAYICNTCNNFDPLDL